MNKVNFHLILFMTTVILLSSSIHVKADEFINTVVEQQVKNIAFKKVGEAKFRVLFWDIYKSRLLTSNGTYSEKAPKLPVLFEIRYLRDITSKDLIERTVEQWQHVGKKESEYSDFVQQLEELWPNIKKGDQLSLLAGNNGSEFFHNGESIGVIESREFGALFLSIWLSEKTSQPKLRNQLLGKTS